MYLCDSEVSSVPGSCEEVTEISGSIIDGKYHDKQCDRKRFNKESPPWS